jgi:class 3 adenylate cyclase
MAADLPGERRAAIGSKLRRWIRQWPHPTTLEPVMLGWITRKNRASIRRTHIAADESGRMIYVPRGAQNAFGRVAFLVPDEATAERIVRIHERYSNSMLGVVVAVIIGVSLVLAMRLVPWYDLKWLLGGACAIAFLATVLGVALPIRKASAGLTRAADRSVRERLEAQDRDLGPKRNVWIYTLLLTGFLVSSLWVAWDKYAEGERVAAIVLGILCTIVYLPMIALGPYYLRLRRHREENARLEGVVRERTAELEELNRTLEARVEEQVRDIERLGQLRQFFTAPVADLILAGGANDVERVHRRELTVISIDLRGFTAFSETAEPEEVIGVLRTYHAELGILVTRYQATLEHFAGDGALIFLNDPVELPDHTQRGVRLATELRTAMRPHIEDWRRTGFDLGMGVGIAVGYATIGAIGYEGRWEYAAIGNVRNLASRLCSEAKDGQVITTHRVGSRIDPAIRLLPLGELTLKGFAKPVAAFDVAVS